MDYKKPYYSMGGNGETGAGAGAGARAGAGPAIIEYQLDRYKDNETFLKRNAVATDDDPVANKKIRLPEIFKNNSFTKEDIVSVLIEYGVPSEVVDLFPDQLIMMFEPRFCRLCSSNLVSEVQAHSHYNSKAHLKKVRVWTRTNKLDSENSARELMVYLEGNCSKVAFDIVCVLCGVHVTSKAQADSHINGKSHQSIVKGKKAPIVPTINSKEAHARLLKDIEDALNQTKPETKKDKEKTNDVVYLDNNLQVINKDSIAPDSKINPALYCNICKVSVNREDHLVTHKNGKKHIFKEKIFYAKLCQTKSEEVENDPFQSSSEEVV